MSAFASEPHPGERSTDAARPSPRRPSRAVASLPAVLLVDEAADELRALAAMLRRDDIEILTASCARTALDILSQRDVAVAIVAASMREIDGFALADLIRSAEGTRYTPIVFVHDSGSAAPRAGHRAGAVDFLIRPLDPQVVRAKIDVLITLERQRQQLGRALEEAERSRAETELLFRLAQATSQCDRPEAVFEPALDAVQELLAAERASILLSDAEGVMRFRAWRGLSDRYRAAVEGHSPWAKDDPDPQPILVADVERAEAMAPYRPVFAAERIRAIAFIPLRSQHRLLGKFMLYWGRPQSFAAHDRDLAVAIATQIAQAIEQARLREAERAMLAEERRARVAAQLAEQRRAAIQQISDAGLAHLRIDDLLDELLARVRRIFACDTATVLLGEPDGQRLLVRACDGIERDAWEGLAIDQPRGVVVPHALADLAGSASYGRVARERLRSLAVVPLAVGGDRPALLHVGSRTPREFTADEVELLQMVGERVALALDRATAYDDVRRAEERLHVALDAARMGVWEWSIASGRTIWSPTLEAIHGLPPGTFPGTFAAFQRDLHPEDHARVLAAIEAALASGPDYHVEYRILRPDGAVRWLSTHGKVLRAGDGRATGMMGVCMDVTPRKELEGAREAAVAELREALRYHEMFAAVLAHDLRNPLGAIMNAARLVLLRQPGDARTTDPMNRIMRSGERMTRMIEQLLDATRARLGGGIGVEPAATDLGKVCNLAVGELELAHPDWQVRMRVAGSPCGTWDQDRLLQVVSNLVANAGQHGRPGGEITVELDGTAAEEVRLRVHNWGGIDAERLADIFSPFRGVREPGGEGLGLGLFITREIVAAHRGTIAVDSTAEAGTTFTVRLPRHLETPTRGTA